MEKFVVTGGKALHGEVTISGAKNAAVGILPATILAADVCVIENLPDISDVAVSLKILSTLGAQVKMLNKNICEYGNTSAASIPLVISELHEMGKVGSGSCVLIVGFGGGLTWGGAMIEFA